MKLATFKIVGESPISFSKFIQEPRASDENFDDYEKRTWRLRMHMDEKGLVFIPPMMVKNSLTEAAGFLSMKVSGSRGKTFKKLFEAGVMVTDPIPLGVKAADVEGVWLHVPSDGMRGGTKRVLKCFPKISQWEGTAQVYILNDYITPQVFESHLDAAGKFVGFGFFRPNRNGYWGRWKWEKVKYADV